MESSDVIAYLDMLENQIRQLANNVRQLRYSVFNELVDETVDTDAEDVLD